MKMVKPSIAASATRVVLSISMVVVFAFVAVAQIESRVGTWELDLSKSTFSPGPPPQRQTLIYRAAGPQWTALLQGIDASGKPINPDVSNLLIKFDGRDHSTPNADYETTAWKRVDDKKYLVTRKKAGSRPTMAPISSAVTSFACLLLIFLVWLLPVHDNHTHKLHCGNRDSIIHLGQR